MKNSAAHINNNNYNPKENCVQGSYKLKVTRDLKPPPQTVPPRGQYSGSNTCSLGIMRLTLTDNFIQKFVDSDLDSGTQDSDPETDCHQNLTGWSLDQSS